MSIRNQTINGMKWQVGTSFAQKVITFGTTLIIARILGPENYGLFALSYVVINAFGLFKSMGIDSALIQEKNNVQEAADTALVIIPTLGIFLYFVLNVSANYIGSLLNNVEIVKIIKVLSMIFVITSFSRVPISLLEKEMNFSKISIVEFIGTAVLSGTAIVFALLNYGVWSLVFAYLAQMLIMTILFWIFAKWKPRLEFNLRKAREMFSFGKFIFLSNVVWFFKENLNNVLIGKLLGVSALGLFAVAFNISNFAYEYLGTKVYRIMFPAYSKFQDNVYDLQYAYLKVLKHISFVAFPMGVGIFTMGSDFLSLAYGEKWIAAIPLLKILAFAGILNTVGLGNIPVFLAMNKPRLNFFYFLIQVVLFLFFVPIGARLYGMNGVGIAVLVISFLSSSYTFILICRLLSLSFFDFYSALKPACICSLLMMLVCCNQNPPQ
ncbi:MAG TPA: lipopolysaccharide biosynthesis protein [Thermotogota bacterium]|nr:lipopolysaccharide biosynthesis protein [Thermotogota bacterium]